MMQFIWEKLANRKQKIEQSKSKTEHTTEQTNLVDTFAGFILLCLG